MRQHARPSRPAFTLLEVLLALAIAILLMGALYAALNMELRHARVSRDVVERSTLARAVCSRLTNDIMACMTPGGPLNYSGSSSSSGSGSTSGSGTTGGSGTGGGSSSGASSSSSGSSSSGSSSNSSTTSPNTSTSGTAVTTNGLVPFGAGVQGTSNQLFLWTARVPPMLPPALLNAGAPQPLAADVRQVVYWLAGSGNGGLARQEITMVSSTDSSVIWPPPDETPYIIAEEVKNITFSFFDGESWNDTWDGSTFGPDGVTPIGPPMAIAMDIDIATQNSSAGGDAAPVIKTYHHVVAIPTAGSFTMQQTSPPTNPNTGTGSTP